MFRQPITLYKAIWFLPCPCNIFSILLSLSSKVPIFLITINALICRTPFRMRYYTYFHYTYKKQSLFASGNGNKDYFFQLGIAVTDR